MLTPFSGTQRATSRLAGFLCSSNKLSAHLRCSNKLMLCGQGNHSTNIRQLQGAAAAAGGGEGEGGGGGSVAGSGSYGTLRRPLRERNKFSSVLKPQRRCCCIVAVRPHPTPPRLDKVKSFG